MKIAFQDNEYLIMLEYFSSHEWSLHKDNNTDMMMNTMTLKGSKIVKLDLDTRYRLEELYYKLPEMGMKKIPSK